MDLKRASILFSLYFLNESFTLFSAHSREDHTMRKHRTKITKEKPKKRILKWFLLSTIIIVLLASSYGIYTFVQVKSALDHSTVDLDRKGDKSELRENNITFSKDPISILLIGVEDYAKDTDSGRADTQIVVTLDPNSKQIHLVTIPRDTRVRIENAGEYSGIHKINAAYTYGDITGYGAVKLQIETVEKLLNIPIDHFVAVNFDGLRDIVNTLGGVTIDVKEGFWEKNIYDNSKIEFKKGKTLLNGEESLAFVRMRKRDVNATYSRDERQRQFLKAVIDQAMSAKTIFKVGQISDILGKNVETDLSAKDIFALQKQYSELKNPSISTLEIDGADQTVDGGSYFIPQQSSLQQVSENLRSILKLKDKSAFTTDADVTN